MAADCTAEVEADDFWQQESFRDTVRRMRVRMEWWDDTALGERVRAVQLHMERQRRRGQEIRNPPGFALRLLETFSPSAIAEELRTPLPRKRPVTDMASRLAAKQEAADEERAAREAARRQAELDPEALDEALASLRKAKRRVTAGRYCAALVIESRQRLSDLNPHDFPPGFVVPDRESAYGRALDWSAYE